MPATHKLKTLPVYFDAVRRGDKTFEIRKNDRDFQTGDTLVLEEFKPLPPGPSRALDAPPPAPIDPRYSGASVTAAVTYVLHGGQFGLEPGHVILGLSSLIEASGLDLVKVLAVTK